MLVGSRVLKEDLLLLGDPVGERRGWQPKICRFDSREVGSEGIKKTDLTQTQ